ncbi:MAG: peptidoglycan editing factor PgeF [Bacteroidota bacterium]|nr:peptidoglycan editing factor PgeF [Bacteroidota bacterium]
MSTNRNGVSAGKFNLNVSFSVGDNPENVTENRRRFFSALGIDENIVAFTQQEHTSVVCACSTPGNYPVSDALITRSQHLFLAISVADCTPVMLYDPKTKTAAAIHAGWRGTTSKIVKKAIAKMYVHYGTKPANIVAFIGPSAGKCCYEVGNEVAKQFPDICVERKPDRKYLLDVKQANVIQLLESGLQEDHIEVHSDCTIHNQVYHSHRRDGKESGRMFAVIGMNN